MGQEKNRWQGFTLIAALLVMVLLSGVAVGLLFLVTNESRIGGNDLEENLAYYGAESGMEKLTSDLSTLYGQFQAPKNNQIQNLINFPPTSAMVGGMSYTESINVPLLADGITPQSSFNTISAGANQGMYAQIIPMTLQVVATRPLGASVNITRQVEVALIPVFQFGVFCGYDCSYFPGPDFSFGGRVHTNQNLFLAAGGNLVFNDKISAFQQVIMDQLENGHPTTAGYGGVVWVPKASGGCPLTFPPTGSNCVALPGAGTVPGDASWYGGYPKPPLPSVNGLANPNFPSISSGSTGNGLNGFVTNSLTGATNMQLPFVKNSCVSNQPPCTDPIAIVRKPQTESPSSALGSARLYNKAQIRILMADTEADLAPERPSILGDNDNIQMNPNTTPPAAPEAFATANTGVSSTWVAPYTRSGLTSWTQWPLLGEITTNPAGGSNPTNNGAWLRVEFFDNGSNTWKGVTREWLAFGFGKPNNANLTAPQSSNTVNLNAILILQQLSSTTVTGANSTDWYPINLYDTREGEMRDNPQAAGSCSVNGIMNVVDLDVGNLARWLNGGIPGRGQNVNYTNENGYVLYFSDHRGMLVDPNPTNGGQTAAGVISGVSGLEDVVNSSANLTSTTPDGVAEAATYYTYSPEDVDQNGVLDNWGAQNIGFGFGVNTNTGAPLNPYVRINSCSTVGAANMVTGARHGLRLIDGGMNAGASYLPIKPAASGCTQSAANPTGCGGFTVVSENPVYIYGNYNSDGSDPFWGTANNANPSQTTHAAAAIIADSVTLLSNQWSDVNSLQNTTSPGSRKATAPAYYRAAISGGKNIPFPQPTWGGVSQDFGTDGGLHNFLRYLEDWATTLNYDGSLVSMYYSEYNTGVFKCCTTVYNPPTRKYYFDVLFLNPANLPPATPMFQDVVNLSYHQNFTPQ
jgi:Tfp pilus assembly protein PilX